MGSIDPKKKIDPYVHARRKSHVKLIEKAKIDPTTLGICILIGKAKINPTSFMNRFHISDKILKKQRIKKTTSKE